MVESSSEGLRKTRGGIWKYVIIAFTCLAPFGFSIEQGEGWHYFYVMALLWSYRDWSDTHGTSMAGFSIVDPLSIIFTSILSCLRFLFAYTVIRRLNGLSSRRLVWITAALSPLPFSLYMLGSYLARGWPGLFLGGPVPMLMIVGLAIAHFVGKEPPAVPWAEE